MKVTAHIKKIYISSLICIKMSEKVYMKVTVHDLQIDCPKHGKVPYTANSDPGGEGDNDVLPAV